ncbi:amidohydrolase family protein [Parabacteroides sp. AM08-6]|uniref:amidohydrolase family protein n=1 Tax=Parabacteroides sp. AM08-6 TaxID=2292053 RepID=UPI000EFF895A|nr:amidohydrolase [Parabacteroides sp. AM08-6]RHJ87893.1 amidohydrolase [Parabacteroides sp. AM08-6]
MSLLIKDVLLNDVVTDVYIENKRIKQIAPHLSVQAEQVIDGRRKAIIPGFVNAHTHAAMTLFRGFGDDMPLMPWLEEKIWPNEAKLTREDIYWGTKLACLEMIKSGTTTFFDMYHKFHATADAVEEMGLRGLLSGVCFDHFQPELAEKCKRYNEQLVMEMDGYSKRIQYAVGPHAIYTVSGELLQWIHAFSNEHSVPVHLHLAETEGEVQNSIKQFGLSPVRYLYKLGVLSPRLVIAHGIYVDDDEIRMLADYNVKVVHNPASNMKLASGFQFKFCEMRNAGITVALGTDGCSSSNNLDMVEAMKLASLLGKVWRKNPEAIPADEIFRAATEAGASAIGLKAGRIAEGYLADICLIDLNIPAFTPNHNFISNLVYAANGSCVDTVICDGKVLMQNKKVPGEEEIMERTAEIAYNLINR